MTHQDVLTSFTRIREAAEAHMDELGHGWAEEKAAGSVYPFRAAGDH